MTVYVIQFFDPIGSPTNKHGQAQYYIGSCADHRVHDRLQEHRNGRWQGRGDYRGGACLTAYAATRGIGMRVIATFDGGREEEKRLKAQKNAPRIVRRFLTQQIDWTRPATDTVYWGKMLHQIVVNPMQWNSKRERFRDLAQTIRDYLGVTRFDRAIQHATVRARQVGILPLIDQPVSGYVPTARQMAETGVTAT